MNNVISLKKPEPEVWVCGCGCRTFYLYRNQSIECANCEQTSADFGGWVEELPDRKGDSAKPVSAISRFADATPEFALRQALRDMGDVRALIIMTDNLMTTWGARQDAPWLDERLNYARARLVKESDDER